MSFLNVAMDLLQGAEHGGLAASLIASTRRATPTR
jgi:hypothetical protein